MVSCEFQGIFKNSYAAENHYSHFGIFINQIKEKSYLFHKRKQSKLFTAILVSLK